MQNIITVLTAGYNKKLWAFIAKCLMFTLSVNIIMGFIVWGLKDLGLLDMESNGPAMTNSFWVSLLLYCVLFPVAETFVFQHIPYVFMQNKNRTILLSACFFGICHLYDPVYFLAAFLIGGAFMRAYIIWDAKPNRFIVVALVHALHNLITIGGLQFFRSGVI